MTKKEFRKAVEDGCTIFYTRHNGGTYTYGLLCKPDESWEIAPMSTTLRDALNIQKEFTATLNWSVITDERLVDWFPVSKEEITLALL